MKSIKLQYIDIKEGRMSTTNFMRNLRRDIPHLVTNVTSFKDAVRILNNKGILNENHDLPRNMWSNMDFDQRVTLLLKFVKDPDDAESWADRKWDDLPDFLDANLSRELENIETQGQMKQDNIDFEKEGGQLPDEDDETYMDSTDLNLLKKSQDDYNDGEFWENKEPEDEDFPDFHDNINEVKTKITAEQAHPQELAMGRKVEMEHTDNVETAEKIALDHLSEDPFYYTKLHIAGLADELNRPKAKKSTKKRTDIPTEVGKDNFTDKGNQMTVVKGVEKIKADANKAKKETNKGVGKITLMSLIAIKPRGVEKMAATGEKMKKISIKENFDEETYEERIDRFSKQTDDERFERFANETSKEELGKLIRDIGNNPTKYNISKDDMRKIVLHFKKKGGLNEDQSNIQNRADEINEFAKLVKSKNIEEIIQKYESIIEFPDEWNITAKEANQILVKYFSDEDWDKFEELTSVEELDPAGGRGLHSHMEEANLNMLPDEQPNDVVTKVQEFIDSNPILRQISDSITLQNGGQDCILKYEYWENLPKEAVEKLSLQFNVEREVDDGDDDKLPTVAYVLTPKTSVDKGMGLNKLDELIKKELKEYFDNDESEYNDEDLNKAARIIGYWIPKNTDISKDMEEKYKYGAFSFEAWDEVRKAMKAIGHDPLPEDKNYEKMLDKISKFVDLLKTKKLIYLEW